VCVCVCSIDERIMALYVINTLVCALITNTTGTKGGP